MSGTRFLADAMLGSLAKWLRILGHDTVYAGRLTDDEMVRLARAEGRIVLTRDTGLIRRRGIQTLFITSVQLSEQLDQVQQAFGLRTRRAFARCPVCNSLLERVPKSEAWGQVPPFVFQTQEEFSLCPECNRFYWRGSHWEGMQSKLREMGR